jgi:hypothetical protein
VIAGKNPTDPYTVISVWEAQARALTQQVRVFPVARDDPAQWPLCRLLLPHQQALLAHPFPDVATVLSATLLNRAGSFLRGSGDAAAALPLYRRALESSERW